MAPAWSSLAQQLLTAVDLRLVRDVMTSTGLPPMIGHWILIYLGGKPSCPETIPRDMCHMYYDKIKLIDSKYEVIAIMDFLLAAAASGLLVSKWVTTVDRKLVAAWKMLTCAGTSLVSMVVHGGIYAFAVRRAAVEGTPEAQRSMHATLLLIAFVSQMCLWLTIPSNVAFVADKVRALERGYAQLERTAVDVQDHERQLQHMKVLVEAAHARLEHHERELRAVATDAAVAAASASAAAVNTPTTAKLRRAT